jgi:multimeric flavodoxin WrbA
MTETGNVLGLVGSPNRDGRTYQMVTAALDGAAKAGARVELIQVADHVVGACKDCLPWECKDTLKCVYPDPAFEYLSGRLLCCGALVLGAPIYWWDTTGMVKYLILKMFRVYARSAPLAGLPALGIGVAGGTGNGLVSGLRPLYHFFQVLQMRAVDPLPVTRLNWREAVARAAELGAALAALASARQPFAGVEDRLLWYDSLPYLGLTRAGERRLLAALATEALPETAHAAIPRHLAAAEALAAQGEPLRALQQVTRAYDTAMKVFDDSQG